MNLLNQIIVTDIDEILTVPSPMGRYVSIENRKNYGLSFCISGKITYNHNGKKIVSDHDHAVLLPQGASYTLFGGETGNFPLINFRCKNNFVSNEFIRYEMQHPDIYISDFKKLQTISLFRNRAKTMSIFYDILSRLPNESINRHDALTPAVKYLEENLFDPGLSNEILAECAGISEVYFRRLFKERYGISPKQYVIEIRINKAKQLLAEHSLLVNEVSEACGFSSVYHFCRAFKEYTGMTPTEFSKQMRINGL